MAANSIDCILTDPPYGLKFMGKDWDHGIPGIPFWKEALRVAKPGAVMLVFGGARTYHRLTCAIEDAGWEIRDCIMWLHGQGFPKSHNFGRKLGDQWEGYGTALKPAYEPIIVCMKPLDGTFLQNAEKWSVSGINIDKSRIYTDQKYIRKQSKNIDDFFVGKKQNFHERHSSGRWPANVILDEVAAELLDKRSIFSRSCKINKHNKYKTGFECNQNSFYIKGDWSAKNTYSDSGGASRFFYCAKACPSDRGKENTHPCVKPQKLLQYLLKMIMPPKPEAIVLDPFVGSGSTLVAAKNLGFNAIGIELVQEYVDIAEKRLKGLGEIFL